MKDALLIFASINFGIVIYIYACYPLLLFLISNILPEKTIKKSAIRPSVSLLISCYNEEVVIREKIENTLNLDYPRNKLEIIVISDGSIDKTDEIVLEYKNQGIRLIRQEGRLGKTCGINLSVPEATGEILVFSDANSIYQDDAITRLVENFADETVGYVVGEAQYNDPERSPASDSENTYWNYEIQIKKLESRIHSIVGGDGAIYAIRKLLYDPLEPTDINDFVNPLQIIAKGYRGIYEPLAICHEDPAGKFEKEFRRKTRIVNRSFSGLLRVKLVMNPFRTGFFSIQILSHKVLRWFSGLFIANFFVSSLYLAFANVTFFQIIVLIEVLILVCAYLGYLIKDKNDPFPIFHYAYYFAVVNVAAIVGLFQSFRGSVRVAWEPHREAAGEKSLTITGNLIIHGLAAALLICFLIVIQNLLHIEISLWKILLWIAIGILLYTYLGYPLILLIWSRFTSDPVDKKRFTPKVTMLICAYNEAEVIEQKIRNSLELDYPAEKLNIVVASDGSTDGTVEIAKKYSDHRITVIDYPQRRGKIGVINKTVPNITRDLILFSDANTMLERESVRKLVRSFSDSRVGAVSADVVLRNEQTTFSTGEGLYYKYERIIQEKESLAESMIGADGGLYAIRRELFHPSPQNTIIDDFVISMNVALKGYRVVIDQEAKAYESNLISHQQEFLRKTRVIAGGIQALKCGQGIPSLKQKKLWFCFVSHKLLRWLTPIFLILMLVSSLALLQNSKSDSYSIIVMIQLAFYLAALVGFLVRNWTKNSLLNVPFYFCLENAAALYGIYKGLFNKQPVMWQKFKRENIEN